MSKSIPIWCGVFTATLATGLLAQTAPAQRPQGEKASTGTVASVTATGCVERWTGQSTPSADGTMEKAPAGVEYVLTKVEGQTASATAAPGAGKTERTSAQTRYLLLSSPEQNFAPHLHHKVKIVGTIAPQPSEGATAEDRAADPVTRETNLPSGTKSEAYDENLVEVSSMTMVSATCGK